MEPTDIGYDVVRINEYARKLQAISADMGNQPKTKIANLTYQLIYHAHNVLNYAEGEESDRKDK